MQGQAGGFFVYTSNVDGHVYDHFEPQEVRECHGNTEAEWMSVEFSRFAWRFHGVLRIFGRFLEGFGRVFGCERRALPQISALSISLAKAAKLTRHPFGLAARYEPLGYEFRLVACEASAKCHSMSIKIRIILIPLVYYIIYDVTKVHEG